MLKTYTEIDYSFSMLLKKHYFSVSVVGFNELNSVFDGCGYQNN